MRNIIEIVRRKKAHPHNGDNGPAEGFFAVVDASNYDQAIQTLAALNRLLNCSIWLDPLSALGLSAMITRLGMQISLYESSLDVTNQGLSS